MARTFESATLQIDPSLQISKNVNFDPRAIALVSVFKFRIWCVFYF